MITTKEATTAEEIEACWEAIALLRPALQKNNFVSQIQQMQNEGYHLLYIQVANEVAAIAGYRIFTMLYCGKILYIDDLSTLVEHRGKGYASAILEHIQNLAINQNCTSVHLDSGPSRTTAHKLYFNKNFVINAFHFYRAL
jgi:GNAT superfamily N-acetyltransferase